jgi:hypothetical protein
VVDWLGDDGDCWMAEQQIQHSMWSSTLPSPLSAASSPPAVNADEAVAVDLRESCDWATSKWPSCGGALPAPGPVGDKSVYRSD